MGIFTHCFFCFSQLIFFNFFILRKLANRLKIFKKREAYMNSADTQLGHVFSQVAKSIATWLDSPNSNGMTQVSSLLGEIQRNISQTPPPQFLNPNLNELVNNILSNFGTQELTTMLSAISQLRKDVLAPSTDSSGRVSAAAWNSLKSHLHTAPQQPAFSNHQPWLSKILNIVVQSEVMQSPPTAQQLSLMTQSVNCIAENIERILKEKQEHSHTPASRNPFITLHQSQFSSQEPSFFLRSVEVGHVVGVVILMALIFFGCAVLITFIQKGLETTSLSSSPHLLMLICIVIFFVLLVLLCFGAAVGCMKIGACLTNYSPERRERFPLLGSHQV